MGPDRNVCGVRVGSRKQTGICTRRVREDAKSGRDVLGRVVVEAGGGR